MSGSILISVTLLGRIQRQTFHFDWAIEEPKNCSKVDKGMIPHLSDDDDDDGVDGDDLHVANASNLHF